MTDHLPDADRFIVTCLRGYKRLVTTQKVEDDRLWLGGYSITYDEHGNEVSRSDNEWNCSVGYEKPSIWNRICALLR